MRLLTASYPWRNLILTAIFTWCGTVEFYEHHTSRDCTEINSGSNNSLGAVLWRSRISMRLLTASYPWKN